MTTYDWLNLRTKATQLFNGDTPGAELEQRILEHFTEHPTRVQQTIESVARRVANGTVHSGWAIVRRELDQKPTDVRVTDESERALKARLAEIYVQNAGGYFDRTTELHDEIFGDFGMLRPWATDHRLAAKIDNAYTTHRPRFQQAEHEADQRAAELVENRKRLKAMLAGATKTLDESAAA